MIPWTSLFTEPRAVFQTGLRFRCSIVEKRIVHLIRSLCSNPCDINTWYYKQRCPWNHCVMFVSPVIKSLKNCTWFRENSCCMQEEIDATFDRVKPLVGASPACQRYTNYLMCYICAPYQNTF
jgi:hypothetical protein